MRVTILWFTKSDLTFFLVFKYIMLFLNRYVPSHLHLMVFELVKNSLRAVQERFMDSDKVSPPVRIIVADGLEDVTIKVLLFFQHLSIFMFCLFNFFS